MLARVRNLGRLGADQFDLLLIGGGLLGGSIALEAAARGLTVALVDRHDFGSADGGLGPLLLAPSITATTGAALTAEQLALLRNARHLARPLLLTLPRGLGVSQLPAHVLDAARYNLALQLTAARQGATVVNYAAVEQLLYQNGRVRGAVVRDELAETHGGQERYEVRAGAVINATGGMADSVRWLDDPDAPALLKAGGDVRILLKAQLLPPDTGLLLPLPHEGWTLFALPWLGFTLLQACATGTDGEAAAGRPDTALLLEQLRHNVDSPVRAADVLSVWVGQTLADGPRRDLLELSRSGLLTALCADWWGARRLAEEAVTAALARPWRRRKGRGGSLELPLVGAAGVHPHAGGAASQARVLADRYGLDLDVATQLHDTYGDQADSVAALAQAGLATRLAPGYPYIEAQVKHARDAEFAQTADDVLERRTRLAYLDRLAAEAARGRVEQLLEGAAP